MYQGASCSYLRIGVRKFAVVASKGKHHLDPVLTLNAHQLGRSLLCSKELYYLNRDCAQVSGDIDCLEIQLSVEAGLFAIRLYMGVGVLYNIGESSVDQSSNSYNN